MARSLSGTSSTNRIGALSNEGIHHSVSHAFNADNI